MRCWYGVVIYIHAVTSVQTPFSHRFEYEDFLNTRISAEGLAVRWNTISVVQEFGMEIGSELIIHVENATAPVTFSLYNYHQWEMYRTLVFDIISLDGYKETLALTCMQGATARITFNPLEDAPNTTYKFQIGTSSQYTLQVESCTSLINDVNARITMVNLGWDNELSEHMGVEQIGLIPVYSLFLLGYLLTTIWWFTDCFLKRHYTPGINYVFALSLLSKTIETGSKLIYFRDFSSTGDEHSKLAQFRDISESLSSVFLLAFLLLCSIGWSWRRRSLNSQERRFFVILFAMYLTVAMIKATCDSKRQVCQAYLLTEYALKSLMLLGIIIALNYSISRLLVKLDSTRWQESKVPMLYARLNLLRQFRWSFLVYLLMPSFVLVFNVGVINPPGTWKHLWASYLMEELITFGIFSHFGMTIRPISPNVYNMICNSIDE